jgi:tetratricopeptide (TPR) repeat protein
LLTLKEGEDAQMALRRAREFHNVAAGAQFGTNLDAMLQQASESPTPGVRIPGTDLTADNLLKLLQVGPLRQTEIRSTLVVTGDGNDRTYRMLFRVEGPGLLLRSIEADAKQTEQGALIAGAEALFEVLKPTAAAFYFFHPKRDPERSVKLARDILRGPNVRDSERAYAYHVWGLVLRDWGDYSAALNRLQAAIETQEQITKDECDPRASENVSPERKYLARLLVEKGYVHSLDGNDEAAAQVFERAHACDPSWPVPMNEAAAVLQAMGNRGREVSDLYENAKALDPDSYESWQGLGQILREQGDYAGAIEAFSKARSLARSREALAALQDAVAALGDTLRRGDLSRERSELVCQE